MQTMKLVILLAVLVAAEGADRSQANPIRKVVQLLENLDKKLHEEMKAEEDLFETYECWYKKTKDSKAGSSQEANNRIASLDALIADIEAGETDYTSRKGDVERQIQEISADIQNSQALRDQEKLDYEAAKAEMERAISVIESTAQASIEANAASPAAMVTLRKSLTQALQYGRDNLSKDDVAYLDQVAHGQYPEIDYKKLNRKATFKMKYNGGDRIASMMNGVKNIFLTNLAEAEKKEIESEADFKSLKAGKEKMMEEAQTALTTLDEENGKRALAKDDAVQEKTNLAAQIEADTQFTTELEASYTTKSSEFGERKAHRATEITAIAKAIALLNGEASSEAAAAATTGLLLLQKANSPANLIKRATSVLMQTAVHDARIMQIAMQTPNAGIAAVVAQIDSMFSVLDQEAQTDLEAKNLCNQQIGDASQQTRMQSLEVDSFTEEIKAAEAKIVSINKNLAEEQKSVADLEAELVAITSQRQSETAAYTAQKTVNEQQVLLIGQAKMMLVNFMTPASSELQTAAAKPKASQIAVHQHNAKQEPAPDMWSSAAYSGSKASAGIVDLMELIVEDIQKDLDLADAAESKAQAEFDDQKANLEHAIAVGNDAVGAYRNDIGAQETEKAQKMSERTSKSEELASTVGQYQALKPGCDFTLLNFDIRARKRAAEKDGLQKAKAILSSGSE